jgi:hypothetical protein
MEVITMGKTKHHILILITLLTLPSLLVSNIDIIHEHYHPETENLNAIFSDKLLRIIVVIEVEGLEYLTEKSQQYKKMYRGKTHTQHTYDADSILESSIRSKRTQILKQLRGEHFRINRTYKTLPYLALSVSFDCLIRIKRIPEIIQIFEDRIIPLPKPTKIQPFTRDTNQPFLDDSREIVGANSAWNFGATGKDWYVAVLDTGIRRSHSIFQGKEIEEQCFSQGSSPNHHNAGGCPNGGKDMSGPGAAEHNYDYSYIGGFDHGTHVAGIATGNNGNHYLGIAKDANIIAVQVFSYIPDWDDLGAYDSDILKALSFVYSLRNDYKIASINMSLGGGEYSDYCHELHQAPIDNLKAAGIATIVSSGNEGKCNAVSFPACIPSAITVNATDKMDFEYLWGNWHDTMVDLMAPGVNIASSIGTNDTAFGSMTGTSMAAPHVSGAWAILKQFDENLKVDEVLEALEETGTEIQTKCGTGKHKPRINIGDALQELFIVAPPINLVVRQEINKSLLQREYINVLTWERNPYNADKNIMEYRIYSVENYQLIPKTNVDNLTFTYMDRRVPGGQTQTYAVTAVNTEGEESPPLYYTINI